MKKKIDPYFKAKLNTPQQPPADAWEFIQKHIPKEEKKRVLPLWAKLSSIAALLLFLIGGSYMFNLFEFENSSNSIEIPNSNQNANTVSNGNSPLETNLENENDQNVNQFHSADPNSNYYPINGQNKTYSYQQNQHTISTSNSTLNNSQSTFYENNSTLDLTHSTYDASNPTLEVDKANKELNPIQNQPEIVWESPIWEKEKSKSSVQNQVENPLSTPLLEELEKENKELIAQNSKDNKKKKSKNDFKKKPEFDRFYITGFVSPMALNTFVGNSMLADDMSQYKTENNVTLAYGLKGAYAISPRVKVRTGVSVVGFEQITKNVPLSADVENGSAASIHDARNNVKYHGDLRIENNYAASLAGTELNNKTINGDIQQQSQYIEIPVEAEVSLFQTSSIGISATAGGSTWLLSKNKIYAHTDDFTEELGKAENLNNTSFSANAGLKFDMKISEKVNVNVEPAFKYLINPVNDIEKYNPYTVGVNAGITVSLK